MSAMHLIDLARDAIVQTLLLTAPPVVVGLLVGGLMALLQAVTQIQEQTLSLVPRMAAMAVLVGYTLPWLVTRLAEFTHGLIVGIPGSL